MCCPLGNQGALRYGGVPRLSRQVARRSSQVLPQKSSACIPLESLPGGLGATLIKLKAEPLSDRGPECPNCVNSSTYPPTRSSPSSERVAKQPPCILLPMSWSSVVSESSQLLQPRSFFQS